MNKQTTSNEQKQKYKTKQIDKQPHTHLLNAPKYSNRREGRNPKIRSRKLWGWFWSFF